MKTPSTIYVQAILLTGFLCGSPGQIHADPIDEFAKTLKNASRGRFAALPVFREGIVPGSVVARGDWQPSVSIHELTGVDASTYLSTPYIPKYYRLYDASFGNPTITVGADSSVQLPLFEKYGLNPTLAAKYAKTVTLSFDDLQVAQMTPTTFGDLVREKDSLFKSRLENKIDKGYRVVLCVLVAKGLTYVYDLTYSGTASISATEEGEIPRKLGLPAGALVKLEVKDGKKLAKVGFTGQRPLTIAIGRHKPFRLAPATSAFLELNKTTWTAILNREISSGVVTSGETVDEIDQLLGIR